MSQIGSEAAISPHKVVEGYDLSGKGFSGEKTLQKPRSEVYISIGRSFRSVVIRCFIGCRQGMLSLAAATLKQQENHITRDRM